MFYITPEDFTTAEANGISADRLYRRVNNQGWTIERAKTQPVRHYQKKQNTLFKHWLNVAEQNDISYKAFWQRVHTFGWDYERAATQPKYTPQEIGKIVKDYHVYKVATKEQYAIAEANGISKRNVRNRITNLGWPVEKAITEPIMSKKECAEIARQHSTIKTIQFGGAWDGYIRASKTVSN